MIKDKKEKQSSGGSSGSSNSSGSNNNSKNNNSTPSVNPTSSSPSSSKSSSSNKNSHSGNSSSTSSNKNVMGIKEEVIEQGSSEQLIVTSIKHEDGSPPSTIIKKEPAASSSALNSGPSTSATVNSNDGNNNNDTNDNKNSNTSGNPDEKDSAANDNSADELLNNDDMNAPGGGNNSSNKQGLHIKNEEQAIDPLASVENNINNNSFGALNSTGSNNRSMVSQGSPDRIQPLPSNVVNKQSNSSMDYMQQQSQIFVFSTTLANKGAEAVRSGQFPTIIAYHCAQPDTKKFLQKFPLKVNQFNRSGWFPNLTTNVNNNKKSRMMPMNQQNFNFMKNNAINNQQNANGPMSNQMGMQGGFPSSCDINNSEGNPMWNQGNQQVNMDPLGSNGPGLDPLLNDSIDNLDPLSTTNQINNSHQSPMSGNICMDPTSPSIPSLQGVKVPDEDLTPQQRSQRAMKLAQLQELKQMFKQEPPINPNECQMNEQDASGNGPCSKMNPMNPNPMMQGGIGNPLGPINPMNMNGPMRPNFPMGPRGNMCRQMGPGMNPNALNDEMMSSMGGPMNPGNMMGPGGPIMGNMNMPPHMQGNVGMNNMGNCNMNNMNNMGAGGPNLGMMGQKNMPPQMMGSSGQAHMEWNKLQQQYYDDNKRKGGQMCGPMEMNSDPSMCSGMGPGMNRQMPPGAMRNMPNMRGPPGQGPPPPYHQTPRSASVPIATQSPNPNSPNNPTSNLSLPSPRGSCNSTLNSPAGGTMNPQHINMKHMNPRQSPTTSSQDSPAGAIGRQMNHSNPSTPISSHLSPSASLKDIEMSNNANKEPNLMPVPSPQQISYLNTFESQELTIQKQPNTNIKDGCSNMGSNQGSLGLDNRLPGQKTPTSAANSHMNSFPIPSSPHTPGGSMQGDKNRINPSGPSPQNSLQRNNSMIGNDLSQFQSHQHPNNQQQSNESNMQFPSETPNMPFGPNAQQQQQNKINNFMDQKPGDMGNNGPPQFTPCSGRPPHSDLPLNPNSNNATMTNTKPSHFDPISSLAQMSQQLTTAGVPGSLNGQPMMSGFNNNGMMNEMGGQIGMGPESQMGGQMEFGGMGASMGPNQYGGPRSMSPKIGGPQMGFPGPGMPNMRMQRPPMGYNGTNIQVKPNAPNTIQYLPARPQMNNANPPRGPPSLEFLQRFTNPMGMDDMNKGGPVGNQQNMPYFPNQNNSSGCGMGPGMDPGIDGPGGNAMGPGGNGPPMMMNQNPMMMRGMRGNGGGNMMRFQGPTGGNNPCMMGNNSFSNNSNNPNMGGEHQMMFNGPGVQQNPQMFVAGPKGSPMNMSGPPNPEQMQMMGSGGNGPPPHFKQQQNQQQQQSHFPSSADPNYAQQYHNFQQQLYATNNQRNQQMGMGGNQAFMPK